MFEKVREDSLVILSADPIATAVSFLQVFPTVPRIVLSTVGGHACETGRAAPPELFVLEGKHREGFDETTRPTFLFTKVRGKRELGLLLVGQSPWGVGFRGLAPASAPIELKSSPAAVAVRTANVALLDFSGHANPRLVRREERDV